MQTEPVLHSDAPDCVLQVDTKNVSLILEHADPRLRIIAAIIWSVIVVSLNSFPALLFALGLSLLVLCLARLPWRMTLGRMLAMDGFIVFMLVILPFTMPGDVVFSIGPLDASLQGFDKAGKIAIKANASILMVLVLVGSLDASKFGHALARLRVPENFVHLLLFTIRYIDVLHDEYKRSRLAMKARGFRSGSNMHSYRTFGYLVGMILVRSMERSERILMAMKCRGFQGRLYVLDQLKWRLPDSYLAAILLCVCLMPLIVELVHVRAL
ncbi:MAG: cobalt ECF transporter T component CbiQ [Cohaesibacteraceae bacterium]|nr:cobalt ECF transporter T component CbiQ [Cohaesibacteraceae bacterium]